jgi:broad specificity phosphatase PhoE
VSTLLLARHGQSVSNAVRRFQGAQDIPLSDLGVRQAGALASAVRGRGLRAVYASPLARARRTAEIVGDAVGMPVMCLGDLRELCLGEWEGRTVDEIRALPGDPYTRWVRDPLACRPPGGEPLTDVQMRVVRVMDEIAGAHGSREPVLVVCHGGVISAYLAHCLGLPLSAIWRLSLGNGSISEVSPPRVVSMNDTTHLDGLASGGAPALSA